MIVSRAHTFHISNRTVAILMDLHVDRTERMQCAAIVSQTATTPVAKAIQTQLCNPAEPHMYYDTIVPLM